MVSFGALAQRNVRYDLDFQSENEIKNALINPFADKATMEAFSTSESYSVNQNGVLATTQDDGKLYVWNDPNWINIGSSDVFRDSTGVQPASGFNQTIRHDGGLIIETPNSLFYLKK